MLMLMLMLILNYGLASKLQGQIPPDLANSLQTILDQQRQDFRTPGASAAAIFPDGQMWLGVSGVSDSAGEIPIMPALPFSIASLSKTHIAALTLLLVETEEVDLDDSLYHWLPAIQYVDSVITIRQLLNHTSGVFSFHEHPAFSDSMFARPERLWTPEDMLAVFMNHPYFPPGEGWHYSNTNYLLLGLILREITGQSPVVLLRERLLEPNELVETWYEIEEELPVEPAHPWHDLNHDGQLEDISFLPRTARHSAIGVGGALVSTARETARFGHTLLGGDVISEESLQSMFEFVDIPAGWLPFTGYGLGMGRIDLEGRELWGHEGDIPGYNSILLHLPQPPVTLCVLMNGDVNNSAPETGYALMRRLIDALTASPVTNLTLSPQTPGMSVYPSPVNSFGWLSGRFPITPQLRIDIWDVSGRRVRPIYRGAYTGGEMSVAIDAGDLRAGVYYIRANSGYVQTCAPMTVIK
ncbi:MAG: serine hydrolase domain-containing protein [Calditrichota bacterium]